MSQPATNLRIRKILTASGDYGRNSLARGSACSPRKSTIPTGRLAILMGHLPYPMADFVILI